MAFLLIAAAVLLAALLGWPVTIGVLRLAKRGDQRPAPMPESETAAEQELAGKDAQKPDADPQLPADAATVLRGGTIIGVLERIAVVLCIVFDQPVAIAYVVAIKGLGRYPELKESPAASERFIIGTLASLIWAAALGILARWLLRIW
ncbi:hypothetical protein [Psychromicrobium xiongbiense]|uniref:hypothetical protein n=1 Tax=Psychromicrobium xiongbiense TaxID=3051184 RepID=UPI0025530312|nr:hypothetical protein [Psychromicrobium sp. YIM S02556]